MRKRNHHTCATFLGHLILLERNPQMVEDKKGIAQTLELDGTCRICRMWALLQNVTQGRRGQFLKGPSTGILRLFGDTTWTEKITASSASHGQILSNLTLFPWNLWHRNVRTTDDFYFFTNMFWHLHMKDQFCTGYSTGQRIVPDITARYSYCLQFFAISLISLIISPIRSCLSSCSPLSACITLSPSFFGLFHLSNLAHLSQSLSPLTDL